MKLKNNLYVVIIVLIILATSLWIILFSKNENKSENRSNKNYTYNENLTNKQFIEKILIQQWIDKKYFDRNICFSIIEDDGSETVSCFVPNDFEEYLKNVSNVPEYKEKLSKSKVLNTVSELPFKKKEPFLQFIDFIAPDMDKSSNKYLSVKIDLANILKSNTWWLNEYLYYYYLLWLEWQFKNKISLEKTICEKFKKLCDADKVNLTVKWKVIDQDWNPVTGAKLRILWDDNYLTKTNSNWEYIFKSKVLPFSKFRLKASKTWMSIWTYNIVIPTDSIKDWNFSHDFTLNKALKTVIIDTENNTISWEGTSKDDKKECVNSIIINDRKV